MKQFGPYRFDDASRVLFRGGQEQSLTRKARDVLACLLAKHGRWVSKEEILDAVWQGTYVHPDNVKVLVHGRRPGPLLDRSDRQLSGPMTFRFILQPTMSLLQMC